MPEQINQTFDVSVQNEGSIVLLFPQTEAAEEWFAENVQESLSRFGGGVPVEPRYAGAIIEGLINDGLTVE